MLLRVFSFGNYVVKKYVVIEWILMIGGKEFIWYSVIKFIGNFLENIYRSWFFEL